MTNTSINMMEFLQEEYINYLENLQDQEDPTAITTEDGKLLILHSFVNWTNYYLSNVNKPVNISYLPVGYGLVMMLGQILAVAKQPQTKQLELQDFSIPITRPQIIPGMHNCQDPFAVNITG